jgi:hypothetical protein
VHLNSAETHADAAAAAQRLIDADQELEGNLLGE